MSIAQDDSVEFDPPRFFQTDLETHRLLGSRRVELLEIRRLAERWVNGTGDGRSLKNSIALADVIKLTVCWT